MGARSSKQKGKGKRLRQRPKRGFPGLGEDEVLEIDECEDVEYIDDPFNSNLEKCTKYRNHEQFIEVEKFSLENLPESIQAQSVYNYIMAHEKLVVKISVKKESQEKKKFGIKVGYGQSATGYAWCMGERTQALCQRQKCEFGSAPHDVYGGVIIFTNHHVIFDDFEAVNSDVKFFYNFAQGSDLERRQTSQDVLTAHGYGLRELSSRKDLVGLKIWSHDDSLYDRVSQFHDETSRAWTKVERAYKEAFKNYAVVISHPHGSIKSITVGELLVLEQEDEKPIGSKQATTEGESTSASEEEQDVSVTLTATKPVQKQTRKVTCYNTATCGGSSGAPVLTGYYHNPERPFTHTGAKNDENEYNLYNFSASY